jgi:nitroreductase
MQAKVNLKDSENLEVAAVACQAVQPPKLALGEVGFQWLSELARSRRSCCGFTGEQLSAELIEELVGIAATAPSEVNLQPWRFVVALGEASLERVMPAFLEPNQPKVRAAGNVVLMYGDLSVIESSPPAAGFYSLGFTTARDFAIRNASLASMLFMLACHARGLATRPMAGYDPAALSRILDIPSSWVSVMTIAVGVPSGPAVEMPPRHEPRQVLRFV